MGKRELHQAANNSLSDRKLIESIKESLTRPETHEDVARRLLSTPEGINALSNIWKSMQIPESKKGIPRVVVLMPSHEQPKPETTNSQYLLAQHVRQGGYAELISQPVIGSSVVHWARNDLIARTQMAGIEFDYILFWDDDIVPPADALEKMLNAKADIVAAGCTTRQDPPRPNFRYFDEQRYNYATAAEWSGEGLIPIAAVGTGLMLISKKALASVGEYYMTNQYEKRYLLSPVYFSDDGKVSFGEYDESAMPQFVKDNLARMESGKRKYAEREKNSFWFRFFGQPLGDGEFGEDISFCHAARDCGLKIFVDTTIRPGHIGRYGFSLNDHQAIMKQEAGVVFTDFGVR